MQREKLYHQTRFGSTGTLDDSLLRARHASGRGRCLIAKAMQVEQTMDEVQFDFVERCRAELFRLPMRCFGANEDLPVLKRDDVGRPGDVHETPM